MSETDLRTSDPTVATADGYKFDLSGGHPALDFANTVSRREDPAGNQDYLPNYGRLVSWAEQTDVVSHADAERLRTEAGKHPRTAAAALKRATAVRESIYEVFKAKAHGERVSPAALDALNALLPDALGALRVEPQRSGFRWGFAHAESELAPMLSPVLRSVADLLTSDALDRVRECGSETCLWLFLDSSKNGSRRWCDMTVCGNREKARRHHQRVKSAARPKRAR